jgi:hypothetical protein
MQRTKEPRSDLQPMNRQWPWAIAICPQRHDDVKMTSHETSTAQGLKQRTRPIGLF